ncbi:hypothetical protein [Flavobacterium sp. XS2P39]
MRLQLYIILYQKEIILYAINDIQKGGSINVELKEFNNDKSIDE